MRGGGRRVGRQVHTGNLTVAAIHQGNVRRGGLAGGRVSHFHADQRQLVAGLYDGSEKGEKIYHTSAWIGRRRQSDATAEGVPGLAKLASWPVSIAYYEPASIQRDSLPSYELSFRIYENGVSTDMVIDYGEFSVRGELKELTYSARSECNASAGAQGAASRSRGSDGVVSPPNKP